MLRQWLNNLKAKAIERKRVANEEMESRALARRNEVRTCWKCGAKTTTGGWNAHFIAHDEAESQACQKRLQRIQKCHEDIDAFQQEPSPENKAIAEIAIKYLQLLQPTKTQKVLVDGKLDLSYYDRSNNSDWP